jgi:hypothetical protein
LGVASVVPVLAVGFPLQEASAFIADPLFRSLLSALFVAAIPEEFAKLAILIGYNARHKSFDEPMDGIVYGVVASLGFATLENVLFVFEGGLASQHRELGASPPRLRRRDHGVAVDGRFDYGRHAHPGVWHRVLRTISLAGDGGGERWVLRPLALLTVTLASAEAVRRCAPATITSDGRRRNDAHMSAKPQRSSCPPANRAASSVHTRLIARWRDDAPD